MTTSNTGAVRDSVLEWQDACHGPDHGMLTSRHLKTELKRWLHALPQQGPAVRLSSIGAKGEVTLEIAGPVLGQRLRRQSVNKLQQQR